MIFTTFPDQEGHSDKQSQQLCGGNRQPDTVNAQKDRKYKYNPKLEYQRPQEGDNRGEKSVVQCRKEGGSKDIESIDQEGDAEQAEAGISHPEQLFIVADKNTGNRRGDKLCRNRQKNAADTHQREAFAEYIL